MTRKPIYITPDDVLEEQINRYITTCRDMLGVEMSRADAVDVFAHIGMTKWEDKLNTFKDPKSEVFIQDEWDKLLGDVARRIYF